ncbi:hypothetical protein VHEMI08570 [[Torrubiella] hemipterigena]|uniref:Esterase-like protein n=1 Tax=[Torrubiella] hemipterigena TaxID=1531966 RepID=A0A0A1TDV6_9HYPO|nr:hypothetical protein VHEMI08570 [[Torrubiella] hemipterigena]
MSARRRQTKRRPASSGRFRKKLLNNPYAQALASPMRTCSATHTKLPRYFLQDFEMVRHPETGKPWFAPGPLSFDSSAAPSNNPDAITQPGPESTETTTRRHSRARAPITVYATCRKSLLDLMNSSHRKFLGSMIGPRGGMAMTTETREAILRKDMGDVLLSMLRRQASDLLVERANQSPDSVARSFQRCDNWEDIGKVTARGCVLWIPGSKDNATNPSYATYDIEGARYDGKVAVHDLVYLLGDAQVSWLRKAAPDTFGDGGIVVLRLHHSRRMAKIHMLLWRLQGYLAPPIDETVAV